MLGSRLVEELVIHVHGSSKSLVMAEAQGEIVSFNSALGLMIVSTRTPELLLFAPCLVIRC